MYFSSMIYKYKRQYPSSSLLVKEVNTEEGIKMVLDGVLDMSVVIEPFEDQRIEKEPGVQSEAVLLVSIDHPFADRKCVSASEFIREPILMVGKEYKYYDFVMSKFREINCSGWTPFWASSSWIRLSMTDFPLRRIPVRTFISSFPIKGRIRLI